MEAPERGSRITPLPPPQPEGDVGSPQRVSRPWAPALFGLAGLFLFALWLIGAQTGDPVPADDAGVSLTSAPLSAPEVTQPPVEANPTTSVVSRPLAEQLPWLQGSLVVFGRSFSSGGTTVWRGGDTQPIRFEYSSSNVATVKPEPIGVTLIAYETDGPLPALHVGGWQRQDSIFVGSQGFAWDPSGSATLAWVGVDQITEETSLYMLRPGPPAGIELVAPLPTGTRLLEWTEAGLVMSEQRGQPVTVLDESSGNASLRDPILTVLRAPDGTEISTAVAEPLRASRTGTVVAIGTSEVFVAAGLEAPGSALFVPNTIVALDSPISDESGFELRRLPPLPELTDESELFSPNGRWSLSEDGNWVGRVSNRDGVATLVVFGLRTGDVRSQPITGEGPASTVGFTPDGARFVVWRGLADELIVVTWLNGEQTVVPFANDAWMRGVYVGP